MRRIICSAMGPMALLGVLLACDALLAQATRTCPNGQCPITPRAIVAAPARAVVRVAERPAAMAWHIASGAPRVAAGAARGAITGAVAAGPVLSTAATHSRHWSWPGDLHDHLRSAHGINTTGMTREEMMTAHDRAHEVGRVVTRSSSVTRSYRVRLFRR